MLERGNLQLTFNEEFNELISSPDGTRGWRTTFSNGGRTLPTNKEAQYYVDTSLGINPFYTENGVLRIEATPRPGPPNLSYTSGLITTQNLFSQLYGFFEIRARLPAGRGFWPAFWLLPVDRTWPPELDVVELLGHDPSTIFVSAHSVSGGERRTAAYHVKVGDVSRGFHTFGASWKKEAIRWYFDDAEIASAPTPGDMNKPMYLLVNLAVGAAGSWPGPSDGISSASLLVDYVRAYQYMS